MRTSLNLTDQDVLRVNTWNHTAELASRIAQEALKVGAEVLVSYGDDKLWLTYFEDMEPKYLSRRSPIDEALAEKVTAEVDLTGPENPRVFDRTRPDRMVTAGDASKPIQDRKRERKVRTVTVGLALVTPQRARKYEVNYARWKRVVNAALGADMRKVAAKGQLVGKNLAGAREIRLTANGTDLTLSASGREAFVYDGIIDATDVARGSLDAWLPVGTVGIAPLETEAEGTVRFPLVALWGNNIRNLRFKFEGGRLVDYSAEKNEKTFADLYESATGDKDRIGALYVGVNPKAEFVGGLLDIIVSGAVSVGIGANEDMQGANKGASAFFATVRDASLRADGTVVVEDGKLKL